jgi:hypothetical protein
MPNWLGHRNPEAGELTALALSSSAVMLGFKTFFKTGDPDVASSIGNNFREQMIN